MSRGVICFTVLVLTVLAFSCKNSSGRQDIRVSTPEITNPAVIKLNTGLDEKLGSWLKKDTECYGIVVGFFADGSTIGKSVKCRIVAIRPDKIKMKTIESVSLLPGEKCDKMGLAYGDTWWEKEGDIFKTREEAETYIQEKGWSSPVK